MKFENTFICGHSGIVDISENIKNKECEVEKAFNRLCYDCYNKSKEKEKERIQKESDNYVTLKGTSKQVEWANEIRADFIEMVPDDFSEKFIEYAEVFEITVNRKKNFAIDSNKIKHNIANRITDAETFINYRHKSILDFISNHLELLLLDDTIYSDEFKKIDDIEKEKTKLYLIETDNATKENIVIISSIENKIKVNYQYDKEFIKIVKSYQYNWESPSWIKESDDAINNMAEIATVLLNRGFKVQLEDLTAVELVKSDSYTRENFNKISFENDCFRVSWNGFDNRLYSEAKSIPTAKWSSVKSSMFIEKNAVNEILEFARINEFEFTKVAKEALEDLRVDNVIVSVTGDVVTKAGLDEILNSSKDILDDLRDD